MSRGYRIAWQQPVWRQASERVEARDEICMDVGLLDILPEADMLALLRQRLADDGWSRDGDGGMSRRFGEVTVTLAPDGRSLTARAAQARDVVARGTTDQGAKDQLARLGKAAEQDLAREVARRITAVEGDVRASVQAALQKVYVEALQRKAAAMGEVESVVESRGADGELELTIKVRV